MKGKVLSILILACTIWISCKTNTTSKCGPCPEYAQLAPFVNVRIVDKTTSADLFLSPNSPYKFSDLKVTGSVSGDAVSVGVDSSQKDNRFVRILALPSQTFTLKLASLSADSLRVVIKQDSPKCCPIMKVGSITLNTTLICTPCSYSEAVTIRK